MNIIISPEINYLIERINFIISKHSKDTVGIDYYMRYDEKKKKFIIYLKYILHKNLNNKIEIIFDLTAEIDPYDYYDIAYNFEKDINDKLFTEILLHTDFTNLKVNNPPSLIK